MSDAYSVDLDHLDQVVTRLSGLVGYLTEHLEELDRRVATLHSGSWQSLAAQAYVDAHTEWAQGAEDFVEGVARMGDAAKLAHRQYNSAATVNTRMLRGKK